MATGINTGGSPAHEGDRLEGLRERADGQALTTDQGLRVSDTDNSLKAGERGPTLMEDFHFREKLTRFDHERIPERVVHARGSAAHGYFQCTQDLSELTRARVFRDPGARTPVFVRFSTVVGFRGSADTVRDVRGFATKFYTPEGNWDLVGNNMPVFFIQDGIKFPDLVHAIKPEPHNEMPQASAAHDTFWDFISLMPESMHMIMWVLSDRALPRSYSMMEGFGVHTFRFVNEAGLARFVKFHWKPAKAMASLVWDEAQKIAGKDPDFNRRDLWEAIERGDYPEFDLAVQVVEEQDEHEFGFDLLDPTKIIPEELVPVRRVGRMVLDRNPDNFFAEVELVAFHPGNVVPGIDFSNDPLLQARLFSYLDTQLIRLGGPNFAEIPINRPACPVHNNQRDGFARQTINVGRVAYTPNSLGQGCPMASTAAMGGYTHYMERVEGRKIRARSASFGDHFSQAALFYRSQSDGEKRRLIEAASFELGKVESMEVRERMVGLFAQVDEGLAREVARNVGVRSPGGGVGGVPAQAPASGGGVGGGPAGRLAGRLDRSDALSMESAENMAKATPKGRMIAVLLADGFDERSVDALRTAAKAAGAMVKTVAASQASVSGSGGKAEMPEESYSTAASVVFDSMFVPDGERAASALGGQGAAIQFVHESFKHAKPIGASGAGVGLLENSMIRGVRYAGAGGAVLADQGVVTARDGKHSEVARRFLEAVGQHRHWDRPEKDGVP